METKPSRVERLKSTLLEASLELVSSSSLSVHLLPRTRRIELRPSPFAYLRPVDEDAIAEANRLIEAAKKEIDHTNKMLHEVRTRGDELNVARGRINVELVSLSAFQSHRELHSDLVSIAFSFTGGDQTGAREHQEARDQECYNRYEAR